MADKFKLRKGAIGELLKSPEMLAEMKARAERVAAAAGPGMEVDARIGANRARASVVTATVEAQLAEARDRRLTSALQAGR